MINVYKSENLTLPELNKWLDEPLRYGNIDKNNSISTIELFWGNGLNSQSFPIQSFTTKNDIGFVYVDNNLIGDNHYYIQNEIFNFDSTVVAQDKLDSGEPPNIVIHGKQDNQNKLFKDLKFLRTGTKEERTKYEKIWIKNDSEDIIYKNIYLSIIDSSTMNIIDSNVLINSKYPDNHPLNKNKLLKIIFKFPEENEGIYPPELDNRWSAYIKIEKLEPGETIPIWICGYVKYSIVNLNISNILFNIYSIKE